MTFTPKPPPDLETLIREKQDQLRGRPLYRWEIVLKEFTTTDWLACGFAVGLLLRMIHDA